MFLMLEKYIFTQFSMQVNRTRVYMMTEFQKDRLFNGDLHLKHFTQILKNNTYMAILFYELKL